jgi:hypothetical protein
MAAAGSGKDREPPFEGGAQPVPEREPEMPGPGRTVMQTVVIVIAVLALLAGILWLLIPLVSG